MTTIKEVLVAALKLETLNDFFIDQNNLTIKLKDKTATVLFENSLNDNNCEDKVYLKDLHNFPESEKSKLSVISNKALNSVKFILNFSLIDRGNFAPTFTIGTGISIEV